MTRTLPLLAVAIGLCLAAGCAPQLDRIEKAVERNHQDLSEMQAENKRLGQDVSALASLLRLEMETGDETNAQRFAKLSQVATLLEQLQTKLEDNAAYMRDLSARVDLLATRAGIPTLGEYKPPPQTEQEGLAALPEEGRSIYQAAQLDRSRGNTELAREGFREFLDRYQRSELADDARYWLGDLAYAAGDWTEARDQFTQLLDEHPQTPWAPAALLKMGYSLQQLGRGGEARAVFQRLVDEHPDSNEAALVRDQLEG